MAIEIIYTHPTVGPCAENCMTRVPNGTAIPPKPPPAGYAFVYAYGKKVYLEDGVTPVLVPIQYANI